MTFSIGSLALIVAVWTVVTGAILAVVVVFDVPFWAAIGLGVFPWLISRSLIRNLRRPSEPRR